MDISTPSTTANLLNNKTAAAAPQSHPPPTPAAGSNGFLKRHHHPPPPLPPPIPVSYKECLKNHAATTGGHALDGCGEFMPSPSSTLNCAACGCHRNFHRRRELDDPLQPSPTSVQHVIEYQPHHRHHPPPPPPLGGGGHSSSPDSTSPPPISSSYYPSAPHMLLALSTGAALAVRPPETTTIRGRKRFRTKFRQDQKEKMQEFAEKVGWKMQKRDEEMISEFCRNVGVERNVLKVWMHNNKNNINSINSSSSDGKKELNDIHDDHYHNDPQLMITANNGSSSSS